MNKKEMLELVDKHKINKKAFENLYKEDKGKAEELLTDLKNFVEGTNQKK